LLPHAKLLKKRDKLKKKNFEFEGKKMSTIKDKYIKAIEFKTEDGKTFDMEFSDLAKNDPFYFMQNDLMALSTERFVKKYGIFGKKVIEIKDKIVEDVYGDEVDNKDNKHSIDKFKVDGDFVKFVKNFKEDEKIICENKSYCFKSKKEYSVSTLCYVTNYSRFLFIKFYSIDGYHKTKNVTCVDHNKKYSEDTIKVLKALIPYIAIYRKSRFENIVKDLK